ncbi:MAG: hypothetical protein HQL08_13765 [Nitrospirae bacterium]|nr:hypothetical protein [Nitrospirota bacterium]
MKADLVKHIKVEDEAGNLVEIKIWQLQAPSPDKPHGYKYSMAYIVNGMRVIGYDNSEGKGDHRHYGENETAYVFRSIDKLLDDFDNDIERFKRGDKL